MREKLAQLANIIAVFPGLYCAYGTYKILYAQRQPQASQAVAMVNEKALLVCYGAFLALVVFGGILFLLSTRQRKQSARPQTTSVEGQGVGTPLQVQNFANVEDFYATFDNALLLETETNIRKHSDKYQPGTDREKFLIRACSHYLSASTMNAK